MLGSASSEATWKPSPLCARLLRHDQQHRALICFPYRALVFFLASNTSKRKCGRGLRGRNQRAGAEAYRPVERSYFGKRLALTRVPRLPECPVGVTVQDMATGRPALFKLDLVSMPRVQGWIGPFEFCGASKSTLLA